MDRPFPKSRVPSYPRLKGSHQVDVVIVGGGLTGCATAYAFAAAGIKVALVEAGQIGRGGAPSRAAGFPTIRASVSRRRKSARPARRAPRLAVLAARGARFHRAHPPPRHEMPARAARHAARRGHPRAGSPAEARTARRARRPASTRRWSTRAVFAEVGVNASGRHSHARRRHARSVPCGPRPRRRRADRGAQIFERTAARRGSRSDRRTVDVSPRRRHHPDEPDRHRHGRADRALQVARPALLVRRARSSR